jgi:hypothetical protein
MNNNKLYFYCGNYGTIFFVRHKPNMTAYVHENDGDFRPEFTDPVLALLDAEMEQVKNFNELSDHIKQELYEMEETTEEDYGIV